MYKNRKLRNHYAGIVRKEAVVCDLSVLTYCYFHYVESSLPFLPITIMSILQDPAEESYLFIHRFIKHFPECLLSVRQLVRYRSSGMNDTDSLFS